MRMTRERRGVMKVTIVIPNYNGKHFMEECMAALDGQLCRDFEVLVVDNGSKDGSVAYMKERYPEVRLIALDTNTGFSGAVNIGIRESKTPYVLLLNNDTKVDPAFVGEMIKAIEADERIFSVSSRMIQMYHPEYIDDAGDMFNLIGWAYQRGVGHPVEEYEKPYDVFSACAGAALYRRDVFEKIGLFDEMHFAYLEDIDVGYRARIAGYRNVFCPSAKVLHVGSGTSGSKYNEFKVKLAARNSIYLVYKNMPLLQLIVNFLPLLLGWLLKYQFFKKQGFAQAFKDGIKEGIRTRKNCKKVPFRFSNLGHYIRIEWEMITSLFLYAWEYFRRKI